MHLSFRAILKHMLFVLINLVKVTVPYSRDDRSFVLHSRSFIKIITRLSLCCCNIVFILALL